MLFEPVTYFIKQEIKRLNEMQPALPFCERGNFLPITYEQSYDIKTCLYGAVPKDITGVYLQNGPNAQFPSELSGYNWFQGDGMIHALSIENGKLKYCNRYTQTPKF